MTHLLILQTFNILANTELIPHILQTLLIGGGGLATALIAIIKLYSILKKWHNEAKEKREEYEAQYLEAGVRYGDIKRELADSIYEELAPMQEKRRKLEANSEYVDKVIEEGAKKAREIAQDTIDEVRYKMGLS